MPDDAADHHPAAILAEVDTSGLVGRGGAGFPTGAKMRSVAAGAGPAVVVGNGCEGEPASRKDALLLERSPHLVLDGLQIAATAVGADQVHLMVHAGASTMANAQRALAERRGDRVPTALHVRRVGLPRYQPGAAHARRAATACPTLALRLTEGAPRR